jgi:hypothetical protein
MRLSLLLLGSLLLTVLSSVPLSSFGTLANPLGPASTTDVSDDGKTALSNVTWITNAEFSDIVMKDSASLGRAVAGFQHIISESPRQTMKEYDSRVFHVIVRRGFPVTVTVTHAGGNTWTVSVDKPDTQSEGPHAPSLLEIVGNDWQLICHLPHSEDQAPTKIVVAKGTVQ